MQFVITAYDGAGKLDKRLEVRANHLENLGKIDGKVICAGGLLDEEGKMKGSVIIMDFDSREALDEYLKGEPYVVAGVWEKIQVERINVAMINAD